MVSSSRQRIVNPDGATTSLAQAFVVDTSGAVSWTSLNTTGTGRLETRFVFVSHQFRVASGTPYCLENAARVRPLRRNCSTICSRCSADARFCRRVIALISMRPAYRIMGDCDRCTPLTAYRSSVPSDRLVKRDKNRKR